MDTYPDRINDTQYGTQIQLPSYRSEFSHDLPYDPGATSSLFELNYFPSGGFSPLLGFLFFVIFGFFFIRKRFNLYAAGAILLTTALAFVFFGPLRLPSIARFNTVLGLSKFIVLFLAFAVLAVSIYRKQMPAVVHSRSFVSIGAYIISLLLSVFVITNIDFFLTDFGMVVTGLFFYGVSFSLFDFTEIRKLLLFLGYALIPVSMLVFLVAVMKNTGVSLIGLLYPKYENVVFMHDLSRGRVFSIVDFEYFIACALFAIILFRSKRKKLIILVIAVVASFTAILLVNYRYRFLTFLFGIGLMWTMLPYYRRLISRYVFRTMAILFLVYTAISIIVSKGTIIDRFLLRDYYEDQVSVERRLYMYGQAFDLFQEHPVLGVGMGNYRDNVNVVYSTFGGRTYEPFYKILQNVYAYPHNWFLTVLAENGIVGFAVLMYLLLVFAETDIRLARRLKGEELALFATLSTISWSYVFANNFTMMHVSLPMVIYFWATRGMIDRIYAERVAVRDRSTRLDKI